MRRAIWILVGIAALIALLVVLWTWIPSIIVQQRVASALRARLQPAGTVAVRARTNALMFIRGRVDRLAIDASGVRLGDVTAERLTARLRGAVLRSGARDGDMFVSVESGSARVEISQAGIEQFLRTRGVENPSVTIDEAGVTATGGVRVGPLLATARLRGQFQAANATDIYFRVTSLDLSGVNVSGSLATTALNLASQPVVSLRGFPVPVTIDRIVSRPGSIEVRARAGRPSP